MHPRHIGESAKKAIERGVDVAAMASPSQRGRVKHHVQLYPVQQEPGEDVMNILQPFLLVVAAAYCKELDPPIEDGCDAQEAVLGFLVTEKAKAKLVGQVCKRCLSMTSPSLIFF